jgi:hypothetical protein
VSEKKRSVFDVRKGDKERFRMQVDHGDRERDDEDKKEKEKR